MANKEIEQQAKDFLYELNTARHEYSLSAAEQWTFSQSTEKEKTKLEAIYYPVLFLKSKAVDLSDLTAAIETRCNITEKERSTPGYLKDRIYFVAYCATKLK